MSNGRNRIVGLILLVALLGGACSGSSGTSDTVSGSPTPDQRDTGDASSSTAATVAGGFVSAAEASRAAAAANAGREFGGEEFGLSARQLVERSEAVEAAIGECMSAAGFEYFPVDFTTIRTAMSSDKSAPGLSRAEFVERYGFGITTQFDKPMVELSLGEQNSQIVDSLGEADRVAYLRTLFGEHTDATYAAGLETEDFSRTGGCTRAAIEQFFTASEMSASYFNPGDALIETDPRALQAISEWYDCMVEGGFDGYLHPDDVEASLQHRIDLLADGIEPEDLTGSAIAELQAEELAVAAVFTRCEDTVLDPAMNLVEEEFYGR